MTRFEEAKESANAMAVMVAFCIAAYLEQSGVCYFTDNALKEFMEEQSEIVEEWLMEEGD